MTSRWVPERQTVRLRNADVVSVEGATITVNLDGDPIAGIPVHGPMPVAGGRVLCMEQGNSLMALGDAQSLSTELRALREEVGMLRNLYEQLALKVRQ